MCIYEIVTQKSTHFAIQSGSLNKETKQIRDTQRKGNHFC